MALVDAYGVILDRPLQADFHFPVVTGIGPDMPLDQRAVRMQLFAGFLAQVNSAQAGAMDHVSEVDLSDEHDLRATITGLPAVAGLQRPLRTARLLRIQEPLRRRLRMPLRKRRTRRQAKQMPLSSFILAIAISAPSLRRSSKISASGARPPGASSRWTCVSAARPS